MRALVPVSVRTQEQRGTLGNQLAAMRGPLPVYIEDPVARLRFVREAMDGLKESKQAVGAATLAEVNNLAPPTILAQASRLNFSTRLFNLIVTNVPGPQLPLYVLGRELQDLFPVAFLPETTRWPSRSCPTTARWTTACSATTTRCPTSRSSPQGLEDRCRSCWRRRRGPGQPRRGQGAARQAPSRAKPTAKPRRTEQRRRRVGIDHVQRGRTRPSTGRPPTCGPSGAARGRPGTSPEIARRAPSRGAGSEAERELRVLAHPLRRPGRREGHRRLHVSTPSSSETNSSICSETWADRAARAGQRVGHAHRPALDLDVVDQPELDEVEAQLGVDHVA